MYKTKMQKSKKGFTLIELLVVIAIIGLLATLAVVALQNARQKSRDARRKGDIKQVYTAINIYLESDGNGRFPYNASDTNFYCLGEAGSPTLDLGVTGSSIMAEIPEDPLSAERTSVATGCYSYRSDGTDFKLLATMEGDDTLMANDGGVLNTRYEIFSPGAQAWQPS